MRKDLPVYQDPIDYVSHGVLHDQEEAREILKTTGDRWPDKVVMVDAVMLMERLGVATVDGSIVSYKGVGSGTEHFHKYEVI